MFGIIFYMNNVLCSNSNQEDVSYPSDKHVNEFLSSKGFIKLEETLFTDIIRHFTKICSIFHTIELIERQININLTHSKYVEQEYLKTKAASNIFTSKNKELFEILNFQFYYRDAKTKVILDENGKEITVFDDEIISKLNMKKPIVKFSSEQVTSGLNKCYEQQKEHEHDMEFIHQSVTHKLDSLRKTIINHAKYKIFCKDQITDECIEIFDLIHRVNQSLVRDAFVMDLYDFCCKMQKECDVSGFITGNSITIFV